MRNAAGCSGLSARARRGCQPGHVETFVHVCVVVVTVAVHVGVVVDVTVAVGAAANTLMRSIFWWFMPGSVGSVWLKLGDLVSDMPHGHRYSESPSHTSDSSDETWHNKRRYVYLARKVHARFRRNVRRARRERRLAVVAVVRFHAGGNKTLAQHIASFL